MSSLAAAPTYAGDRSKLLAELQEEALRSPGEWVRRRIVQPAAHKAKHRSLVVGLRVGRRSNRWQLVIIRDTTPASLMEQARWEADIRELQLQMGVTGWRRGDDRFDVDAVAAAFEGPAIQRTPG